MVSQQPYHDADERFTKGVKRCQLDGGADRIVTSIPSVPVTVERKPFIPNDDPDALRYPGTARVNIAASVETPRGTEKDDWAKNHEDQSVLQQHIDFFDGDKDGLIWPQDTFSGFYRLGFGIILSLISMVVIHGGFSYPTQKHWVPDPRLPIYIDSIHRDKHGSDTGTYDKEGRFIPQHFEDIFAKYAGGKDYLTTWDVINVWSCRRLVMDPFGWGAGFFEWLATYILLWPEDGRMQKEDIRRVYDGSIFQEIASKRAAENA